MNWAAAVKAGERDEPGLPVSVVILHFSVISWIQIISRIFFVFVLKKFDETDRKIANIEYF